MMTQEITLLESKDIAGILLTCSNCKVAIRILLESAIPDACPSCNKSFSHGGRNAARELQAFVRESRHPDAREKVQIWVGDVQ